jgi:predicted lipoprotein with Yx(FWY)xxD motif
MTAALMIGLAACAGGPQPAKSPQMATGPRLSDAHGMTLYTFDRDGPGKSNCDGQCAVNWPPLRPDSASQASGNWSIVTRDDGSKQLAYRGKPLYTWVKDQKPGDTTGEGVNNNTWHVAQP